MLKNRPWWLFIFPRYFWVTITPHIYHPKGINPEIYPEVVAHETTHLTQQANGNTLLWFLKYLFIRSFRLEMEAHAISVELAYDREHFKPIVATVSLQEYSIALSSWRYMWAASSPAIARDNILKYK